MSDRSGAPRPGAQARSLGPHVVGSRIVVRRVLRSDDGSVLTGPSGGPAMTDLLGTCLAWADGICVVQPDAPDAEGADGPVRIPLDDIVSGKPVPPRPSVRQRTSVREAEAHSFVMFPDVDRVDLGDWVLRCDPAPVGRLFKRANSCLALGDPGCSFSDAERAVRDFYTGRGRDVLVQVEADGDLEAAFTASGWVPLDHGEVEFRLGSLSMVRRARRALGGGDAADVRVEVTGDRAHAVLPGQPSPRAEGRAAVHEDWLGLHALHTHLEHRRRGLAGQVVDALLEWGAERGALTCWLHVETDNAPARALYDSLGLLTHHRARYLRPG
ncbi:GNAT family N-acetyltransferase [Nocardioides acrostichi]|uniref:GNAT family N-acetyltransferase n=1 Tax=Nocardioides acrostichi TaxID=2784339 RepID=A0A930V253_9ACTN|nr:GNAT family N-acetyltransferase [Nocardioides acrostichi]MBF4162392.1 GNAT family N-acetyltransferase [Nocardioides acrostichi]